MGKKLVWKGVRRRGLWRLYQRIERGHNPDGAFMSQMNTVLGVMMCNFDHLVDEIPRIYGVTVRVRVRYLVYPDE